MKIRNFLKILKKLVIFLIFHYNFSMNKEIQEEINRQLQVIEEASHRIKELSGIRPKSNMITTIDQFNKIINDFATSPAMKTNLLSGKRPLKDFEMYLLEEKGIPLWAWKDIDWYKKLLKPKSN